MSELLHRCRTKATTAEGDHLRHSLSWIVSRRAPLVLYADRLECGDWTIPYEDVEGAVLVSFWSFPLPGHILRLRAHGRTYQFGLDRNRFWKGELPLGFGVGDEAMAAGQNCPTGMLQQRTSYQRCWLKCLAP